MAVIQRNHKCVLQWNCRGLTNKAGELRYRTLIGNLPVWALLLQENNSLPSLPGFHAYAYPTIPDRRCSTVNEPPGKAAVYVASCYPQTQMELEPWCNKWQEVVAVFVRLPQTDIILVSCYVRPHSGSSPVLRVGWIESLLHAQPVSWDREPDCWGSDHYPIRIGLAPVVKHPHRRRCCVTDWDLFRRGLNIKVHEDTSDPLYVLRADLRDARRTSWVGEKKPTPDLHHLNL